MSDVLARPLTGPVGSLTEAPFWDDVNQRLLFVDMDGGVVWEWHETRGATELWRTTSGVAAVVTDERGRLVVVGMRAVTLLDSSSHAVLATLDLGLPEGCHVNDARCDTSGRLWLAVADPNRATGKGGLYVLDHRPTRPVHLGFELPNGVSWSRSGAQLYVADSLEGAIFQFDVNGDRLSGMRRRDSSPLPPLAVPDGMTVDAQDALWVAMWDGGSLLRYGPHGLAPEVVRVGPSKVTSCCFGGATFQTLYVTTASNPAWPFGSDPEGGGGVFAVDVTGVSSGYPSRSFGGWFRESG